MKEYGKVESTNCHNSVAKKLRFISYDNEIINDLSFVRLNFYLESKQQHAHELMMMYILYIVIIPN